MIFGTGLIKEFVARSFIGQTLNIDMNRAIIIICLLISINILFSQDTSKPGIYLNEMIQYRTSFYDSTGEVAYDSSGKFIIIDSLRLIKTLLALYRMEYKENMRLERVIDSLSSSMQPTFIRRLKKL
jgi:hypothetical protein